jgi:hypothetical protein
MLVIWYYQLGKENPMEDTYLENLLDLDYRGQVEFFNDPGEVDEYAYYAEAEADYWDGESW